MKRIKTTTRSLTSRFVWTGLGILVMTVSVVGVMARANAATSATDIDWGKLQEEIDDPTGGVTRAHQIEERAGQEVAKTNQTFDEQVKKCLANKKGCSDQQLKMFLKEKNRKLDRIEKNKKQQVDQATGKGHQAKSNAKRAVAATFRPYYETYSNPQMSNPPSGGTSGGGTSTKPFVIPCVDLNGLGKKIKPSPTPLPASPGTLQQSTVLTQ